MRTTPLHKAAMGGHVSEVAQALSSGGEPSARDAEGRTPLHHAVMRGHVDVVDVLLKHGGPGLLMTKDILGCTPIHLAAVQNQVMLIVKLVNALAADKSGKTPLHEVVRRGCMQDFMGFLHLGWDTTNLEEPPDAPLETRSPAWAAVAAAVDLTCPGLRVVQRVLGWAPLHVAAVEGNTALIRTLVQAHGCDVLVQSANSWSPLHYAAGYNRVQAIELLVSLGCPVDVRDSVMCSPLHVAAGEGHLQAIAKLIQLGCSPCVRDRDGCTPLYCAAAWNRLAAVQLLEQLGCSADERSEEGRTAVHVAAEQGWVDLLDYLISRPGADGEGGVLEVKDSYDSTPLHSAANGGHARTISRLVQRGHVINPRDYLGRTPLHYAAMHGRIGAVEQLINLGASLGDQDWRGDYTPLHLAADAGQVDMIAKLAQLGADVNVRNSKGYTPLVLATVKGPSNVDAITTLVELGADLQPVLDQANVETPLHVAARSGRVQSIERLLACRVPVMLRTKDGSTALHYAAAFGQTHVLETLVKAGCPVDARDNASNTPLHLAAGCGFKDTVAKLVAMGADVNARDITMCTPLQNAAHGTYSALANMPADDASKALPAPSGAQLTAAQQQTQAMLTSHNPVKKGNLMPVRTGLAWASFGGSANPLSSTAVGAPSKAPGLLSDGSPAPDPKDWRGTKLMQLLKRASKRYGSKGLSLGISSETPPTSADAANASTAALGQAAGQLVAQAKAMQQQLQGQESDKLIESEFGLEALLRRTEQALTLAGHEADRSRLVPVAAALVDLGADVYAVDNEGRTALHLAAGCGDKSMVARLVELGSDVGAKDSVGGTPMHHAAMANKKDIMFMLARLGCDWRAKADGIDGATAAFVLCGQHGKTTRQQKLLEVKLKRMHQEGIVLRAAGLPSLTGDLAGSLGAPEGAPSLDLEEASLLADRNMAALLEEEETHDAAKEGGKKKKKKKRSKKVFDPDAPAAEDDGEDDGEAEGASVHPHAAAVGGIAPPPPNGHASAAASSAAASSAAASVLPATSPPSPAPAPSPPASPAVASEDAPLEGPPEEPTEELEARRVLESVAATAAELCRVDADAPPASLELLQRTLKALDAAIDRACALNVGAKYAKKVRKRLQTAIMNMTIGYQSPSAARSTAVRGQPRHSDDDRSESRASTAQSEGPAPAVMPASPPPQAAPAGSSEPGRGKAQGRAVPREQSHAPSVVAASRSKARPPAQQAPAHPPPEPSQSTLRAHPPPAAPPAPPSAGWNPFGQAPLGAPTGLELPTQPPVPGDPSPNGGGYYSLFGGSGGGSSGGGAAWSLGPMLQPAQPSVGAAAAAPPPPRPSFGSPAAAGAAPNAAAAAQLLLYQQQLQQQQLNALLMRSAAAEPSYAAAGGGSLYGGAFVGGAPSGQAQAMGQATAAPAGGLESLLSGAGLFNGALGGPQGPALGGTLGQLPHLGSLNAADIQALRMQLAAASLQQQQQQGPPGDGQRRGWP